MQCPTATRVAGFQTWRSMGRFVRRGEEGIVILAPIVGRRAIEAATDESEMPKTIVGFRGVHVFDVLSRDSVSRFLCLSRPHLRRALQTPERVRDAVVDAPGQAIQQPAPPPGREREVSAVAEQATARVDRRTRDPVVADQPERQARTESDRGSPPWAERPAARRLQRRVSQPGRFLGARLRPDRFVTLRSEIPRAPGGQTSLRTWRAVGSRAGIRTSPGPATTPRWR